MKYTGLEKKHIRMQQIIYLYSNDRGKKRELWVCELLSGVHFKPLQVNTHIA